MRGACIDIGSNTTRLLVADCDGARLSPVVQERVFTHIGRGVGPDGRMTQEKIEEVAQVVCDLLRRANESGPDRLRVVATAAIRRASNSAELAAAIQSRCELPVEILSGEEEARLAFIGAANAIGPSPPGTLGVADVGGGSCELVVGEPPDLISWSVSFKLGSADVTESFLHSDPPAGRELSAARASIAEAFSGLATPAVTRAVAVGGSATSLGRVAGAVLDTAAFRRALELLCTESSAQLATRFGLAADRLRLLPAGLLILQAASEQFGRPLAVGGGGIREGVLLEACAGSQR